MQALIDHPLLKMIQPSISCWLAHDRSVRAVRCSLRPDDTFEHIHKNTREPEALGMLKYNKEIQLCGNAK